MEAQRSNVEVNVRESMVKVLVIENRAYEYPDAAAVNKLYALAVNVTKFLNGFPLFSFTGKWPC